MKLLIINIFLISLLSSCAKDREYIKDLYFSHQMERDLEKNRNELYRQSYVGVRNEVTEN